MTLPLDFWLPNLNGDPYQILAPDLRPIVNFMPYDTARTLLGILQTKYPFAKFTFQTVPEDQMGDA